MSHQRPNVLLRSVRNSALDYAMTFVILFAQSRRAGRDPPLRQKMGGVEAEKAKKTFAIGSALRIEPAPSVILSEKTDCRLEAMEAWQQISERVVPGAALVAVDGDIVPCIDLPAEALPVRQRVTELDVRGVEIQRG